MNNGIDWTYFGMAARHAALDAHGYLVPAADAYQFLLDNPECFLDGDDEWPAMPVEPPDEFVAAYYPDVRLQLAILDCMDRQEGGGK